MSLPLKSGVALVTVGTVGGVGYGIVAYSKDQGTEISKLIEKEYEYILLKAEDKEWAENWKNYKDGEKNIFSLDNWDSLKSGEDSTELKKKCNELSSKKILNKDDELYENVGKYCGRSVTIEDEAGKNNLTILKTDSQETDTQGDGIIWKKREEKRANLQDEFTNLNIKKPNPAYSEIRTGCGSAKSKNKKEANYKAIYEAYVKVCTKHKEDIGS